MAAGYIMPTGSDSLANCQIYGLSGSSVANTFTLAVPTSTRAMIMVIDVVSNSYYSGCVMVYGGSNGAVAGLMTPSTTLQVTASGNNVLIKTTIERNFRAVVFQYGTNTSKITIQ